MIKLSRISNNTGFTLIELLVVIAIIGLLSSITLASLSSARSKARDSKRIADLAQIKKALEFYYDDYGYYPGTHYQDATYCTGGPPCWDICVADNSTSVTWDMLEADLSPYIKSLPKDPINTSPGTTGCTAPNCYAYSYNSVGRFGINPINSQTTTKDTYSLKASLENEDHPLACKNTTYFGGDGCRSAQIDLCNFPNQKNSYYAK